MIKIPSQVKKLIKKDGVRKNFRVHFIDGSIPDITNEKIIEETVSFSESLCEETQIKFGLSPYPQIEFETIGIGNIKGKKIECSLEIDCSSLAYKLLDEEKIYSDDPRFYEIEDDIHYPSFVTTPSDLNHPVYSIPYGEFVVDECKKQTDMTRRKVVATFTEEQLIKCEGLNRLIDTMWKAIYPLKNEYQVDGFGGLRGYFGIHAEDIIAMISPEYVINKAEGSDYFTEIGNFQSEHTKHDYIYVSDDGTELVEYTGHYPSDVDNYTGNYIYWDTRADVFYKFDKNTYRYVRIDYNPTYIYTFYYGIKTQSFCSDEGYSVTTFYTGNLNEDFKNFLVTYDENLLNEKYLRPRLFDYTPYGGILYDGRLLNTYGTGDGKVVERKILELDKPLSTIEIVGYGKYGSMDKSIKSGFHLEYGGKSIKNSDFGGPTGLKVLPGNVEMAFLESISVKKRSTDEIYTYEPDKVNGSIFYHTHEVLTSDTNYQGLIYFDTEATDVYYYSVPYDGFDFVGSHSYLGQATKMYGDPGLYISGQMIEQEPINSVKDYDWTNIMHNAAQYGLCFIAISRGKIKLIDLSEQFILKIYDNETIPPDSDVVIRDDINKSDYSSVWYEDVYSKEYQQFGGYYTNEYNSVSFASVDIKDDIQHEEYDPQQKIYRIEDIEQINNSVFSKKDIFKYLNSVKSRLKGISYLPMELTMIGRPDMEIGDVILVETDNGLDTMLVERRELSGIDNLIDSITSEDEESSYMSGSKSGTFDYNANTETLIIR